MKRFLLPFAIVFITSCTSTRDFQVVKRELEMKGYTNVQEDGFSPFCCGDDKSTFQTGRKAVAPNGEIVYGCACSSVLSGTKNKI